MSKSYYLSPKYLQQKPAMLYLKACLENAPNTVNRTLNYLRAGMCFTKALTKFVNGFRTVIMLSRK